MKKPNEWYIRPTADGAGEYIQPTNPDWRREPEIDSVLVIEMIAYEAMELKVRKLEAEVAYLHERFL